MYQYLRNLTAEQQVGALFISVFGLLFMAFSGQGTGLLAGACFLFGAFLSLFAGFVGMKADVSLKIPKKAAMNASLELIRPDGTIVTAEDGEAALDYLAEATRLPDFIFTDLEMPNMNGFDFIQNMRRMPNMEDIPTVVVSSRDGDKRRAEARKVGANDFMAKGAKSAEGLQAMIHRYLDAPALAS